MSNEAEELRNSLSEFQRRFAQLPDVEALPKTLLHVLRRGSKETYWNKILSYFLNPTEPHGFGTDFLEAFLSLLKSNSELTFDFTGLDFSEIEVESEWTTHGTGDRPDIVIYSGRNWFVCVEMKVGASEGKNQTKRYARSTEIGDIPKNEFPENGQYYVYLSGRDAADASADEFANVSWREVVAELERFQVRSRGRYPAKSLAQLDDFLDTIRREMNTTNGAFEENQLEKMQLYLKYPNEIDRAWEAREAFDDVYEREVDSWSKRFYNDFKPSNWSEKWHCESDKWGQIYREGWRRTNKLKPTNDRDEALYRVEFRHYIENKDSFKHGTLTFRLYCPATRRAMRRKYPEMNTKYREKFRNQFHSDEDVINSLQKNDIQRTEPERTQKSHGEYHTLKTYNFDQQRLPNSYYGTLKIAFEEHHGIVDLIADIHRDTLNEI